VILVAGFALLALSVLLRPGRLAAITTLRFRWSGAVVAAIAIQVVVFSVIPADLPPAPGAALHFASYALAVAFLVVNRRVPGLGLVGVGGLCNLVAIGANGGVMPASRAAMASAGIHPAAGEVANSAALAHPRLLLLGDVFALPHGLPFANVFSVGDALLLVGAAVMLHRSVRAAEPAPLVAA
jgi:hypothetical protein